MPGLIGKGAVDFRTKAAAAWPAELCEHLAGLFAGAWFKEAPGKALEMGRGRPGVEQGVAKKEVRLEPRVKLVPREKRTTTTTTTTGKSNGQGQNQWRTTREKGNTERYDIIA